ncbi:putative polyprenol reductase [Helianthus anomalus]
MVLRQPIYKSYYIATPLSLCCTITPEVLEFVKNLDITELNMLRTKFDIWLLLTPLLRLRWYAWIGAVIFVWGWVHQFRCHVILLSRHYGKLEEGYV